MESYSEADEMNQDEPHTSLLSDIEGSEIQYSNEPFALPQIRRNLEVAIPCPELPFELWCIIFLECMRVDPRTPTTISHVCRCWRQVAINLWELWNRIDLGREETGLDRASAWAERSKSLPIDLVVRCSGPADRRDMIPWLQERGGRICSMSVLHMHQGVQNRLLPSLPPFQSMEKLQILGLEEFDLNMRLIARVLQGSPGLYSLSLAGVGGLHFPEALMGIATQLTHLSLGELSQIDYQSPLQADVVLAVISACTSLQSLECHALSDEVDDEPPTAVLPYLSSLSIGDSHETCIILRYLHAPRLRSFRLVHGRHLDENEEEVRTFMDDSRDDYANLLVECLEDLHASCSPQVTKVVWDRSVVDIRVLDRCTAHLRYMEELHCRELENPRLLARCGFLWQNAGGALCPYPRLRSISFIGCTLGRSELYSIMSAIRLRGPPHSEHITIMEDSRTE